MPRRNASKVRAGTAKKFSRPVRNIESIRLDDYNEAPERKPKKPGLNNQYTRNLTGFSDRILNLLVLSGLENVDADGRIAVTFMGISQAPRRDIRYKKPTALQTRGGLLVISGL